MLSKKTYRYHPDRRNHLVTVPGLPCCFTLGNTYEEAVRQGEDAIGTWVEGSKALGLPIPEPNVLLADAL
ncbi:MAG TPA: HicB family protein [Ktedonobacter sp.]|nr:HicB family protein [Ktedonobacter sp.]